MNLSRRAAKQQDTHDYGLLSGEKIRELLETPRSPRPGEDEEGDRWPSRKKAAERSEQERKELQGWAAKKRAKSLAEYKKQREALKEKERAPYRSRGAEAAVRRQKAVPIVSESVT